VRASLDGLRDAFEPQGFDPALDARTFTLGDGRRDAALFVPLLADDCSGPTRRSTCASCR
jgi:hypothetical protein